MTPKNKPVIEAGNYADPSSYADKSPFFRGYQQVINTLQGSLSYLLRQDNRQEKKGGQGNSQ
jgi:hypothetical protein